MFFFFSFDLMRMKEFLLDEGLCFLIFSLNIISVTSPGVFRGGPCVAELAARPHCWYQQLVRGSDLGHSPSTGSLCGGSWPHGRSGSLTQALQRP